MKEQFKELLSQYTPLTAGEITDEMRFREDLQMSSLDFATLLGEMEDELDMDFEDTGLTKVATVGEAIEFLEASK